MSRPGGLLSKDTVYLGPLPESWESPERHRGDPVLLLMGKLRPGRPVTWPRPLGNWGQSPTPATEPSLVSTRLCALFEQEAQSSGEDEGLLCGHSGDHCPAPTAFMPKPRPPLTRARLDPSMLLSKWHLPAGSLGVLCSHSSQSPFLCSKAFLHGKGNF